MEKTRARNVRMIFQLNSLMANKYFESGGRHQPQKRWMLVIPYKTKNVTQNLQVATFLFFKLSCIIKKQKSLICQVLFYMQLSEVKP